MTNRYAILIDYEAEGLKYLTGTNGIKEFDDIGDAIREMASEPMITEGWEIVDRISLNDIKIERV